LVADYQGDSIDEETAAEMARQADEFVAAMRTWLAKTGFNPE
jgi:hypothetical protein